MTTNSDRSALMARIRGKNTSPEIRLRKALWAKGLRYRIHLATPAGRPDIVFPRSRIAVFIDGCFWHGCPDHYVQPRSREDFWTAKLLNNVGRDRRQTLKLEELGWTVCRIWEHEVEESLDDTVARIEAIIRDGNDHPPPPSWRVVEVQPLATPGGHERRILERLRDPQVRKIVERERSTKKWSRGR
jgi:DNA mismatch endonuclease, patch repair protein